MKNQGASLKKLFPILPVLLIVPLLLHADTPKILWEPSPLDIQISAGTLAGIRKSVEEGAAANGGQAIRDAHAKDHGCVLAEFKILPGLDREDANYGIFSNAGKVYEAAIRFSNGSGKKDDDDRLPGSRGAGIKVMGVEGTKMIDEEKLSQDFPMISHPVFFVKNAPDYAAFMKDRKAFMDSHRDEKDIIEAMQNPVLNPPKNLARSTYFSTTPRQLGPTDSVKPIKYSAEPVPCSETEALADVALLNDPNALQIALQETLKQQDFCFNFRIQRFVNEDETPVNNPTKEWKTPWITVATIKVLKEKNQDIAARALKCEDVSINPWHSLAEHQPLGAVEFIRKDVYRGISETRHKINGRPLWEPTSWADWDKVN